MLRQTNPVIESRIFFIRQKNNYYINQLLDVFINDTLAQIYRVAESIHLDEVHIEKACNAFLDRLERINFIIAYSTKTFKRVYGNDFDIDKSSFDNYIYKQIPSLRDVSGFVSEVLGINDKKKEILAQLQKIKSTVNEYTKDNKKLLVQDFNRKIDLLIADTKQKPYFECIDSVRVGLNQMLRDIQADEDRYYLNLRFWANSRQRNSTLQQKINTATQLLADLKLENVFAVKGKDRLPVITV